MPRQTVEKFAKGGSVGSGARTQRHLSCLQECLERRTGVSILKDHELLQGYGHEKRTHSGNFTVLKSFTNGTLSDDEHHCQKFEQGRTNAVYVTMVGNFVLITFIFYLHTQPDFFPLLYAITQYGSYPFQSICRIEHLGHLRTSDYSGW